MKLVELTINEFDEFAKTHPLRNFCQSSTYARFMGEQGFNYDYLGYKDDNNQMVAATLILYKKISTMNKYAYAPKGFLIDYYNVDLLANFTKDLTKAYRAKGVVFLKINPEIIIGEINPRKSFSTDYNQNFRIIDDLKALKYKRRREIEPMELIAPRISPYINLKKYDENKLNDEFRSYILTSKSKGLIFETATSKETNAFYQLIKDKANHELNYYRNLLNVFDKTDMAEILLVKVDYREFLLSARQNYDIEQERNNDFNRRIQNDASETNLNKKMASDKLLLELKQSIVEATEGLKRKEAQYIAGAIVVKYLNRVSIITSGFDPYFNSSCPMYFLYSKIIEKYQDDYDYLDLNGYVEGASLDSMHHDLNEFKMGFKPNLYEFIGEFDIILDELRFKSLQSRDLISTELKGQRLN